MFNRVWHRLDTISGIRASAKDMGEVMVPATGKKEGRGGPSSIQCPMLTSSNYTVWAMRMKITLKVHKVWEVIETESTEGDKNDMATILLFQSCCFNQFPRLSYFKLVSLTETIIEVWLTKMDSKLATTIENTEADVVEDASIIKEEVTEETLVTQESHAIVVIRMGTLLLTVRIA